MTSTNYHRGIQSLMKNHPRFPLSPIRPVLRGSQILDHTGNPIMWRGHNWGRWGTATLQDAIDAKAQGANIIRLPLRWWGLYSGNTATDSRQDGAPGHIKPANLTILDNMIAWCVQNQLWWALFHDSDCGQNSTQGYPDLTELNYCVASAPPPKNVASAWPNGRNFFTDPAMKQEWYELLAFVSDRYKNVDYHAWTEPLSEPSPPVGSQLDVTNFYIGAARAIFGANPNAAPLMIGSNGGYNINTVAQALIPANLPLIYTGDAFMFTTNNNDQGDVAANIDSWKGRVDNLVKLRDKHNVPVVIQQVSVHTGDDPVQQYQATMLNYLLDNRVAYTWWEYKDAQTATQYGVKYLDVDGVTYITKAAVLANLVTAFAGQRCAVPPPGPQLSHPSFGNITATSVNCKVTTDTANGTIYVALSHDNNAPSPAQIKLGKDSHGVIVGAGTKSSGIVAGVNGITVSGLTTGTTYFEWFVQTNSAGTDSNITGQTFTTA